MVCWYPTHVPAVQSPPLEEPAAGCSHWYNPSPTWQEGVDELVAAVATSGAPLVTSGRNASSKQPPSDVGANDNRTKRHDNAPQPVAANPAADATNKAVVAHPP